MRLGIVSVIAFIAAYIASIAVYLGSGMGHVHVIADGPSSDNATRVTFDIQDIQSRSGVLRANVIVSPESGLLDSQTHNLKEDRTVATVSATGASKHTWPKGTLPDFFAVSLMLTGDVADWPFDSYSSGPSAIDAFSGAGQVPVPTSVQLVHHLLGWNVDVARLSKTEVPAPYQLELDRSPSILTLRRSPSTAAFAVVILGAQITLAGVALFVAVQTARKRRKYQPQFMSWYAAMLFAVIPLRNALPDSPPFGSWIDVTIVLWVVVVLVISLTIYTTCWWRDLRPDDEIPSARRWTRWRTHR